MSDNQRCRDRREAWLMGVMSAAMLILPLVAWGAVKVVPAVTANLFASSTGSIETNAVGTCRSYCEAQRIYHRNDWNGDGTLEYANPTRLLRDQLDANGQPIQLIDQAFAAATIPDGPPKTGYVFREIQTIAGQPIDRSTDFALCAVPADYGRTGYRTFIVRADGIIYCRDLGPSAFVTDFPADPAAAGWVAVE